MGHAVDSYRRFLQGDDSGLAEIISDHKDGLILYLNGFVNDLNAAEELTEEVFVKLVMKRPHFYQNAAFKTWLYTIGRNTAIDHLRRSRKAAVPLEVCPQLCDEEASLEQTYIQKEDKILLHRCMKKLKPEYRQVLWLVYFEGFRCGEVGKIMGKSEATTQTLVSRARKALKEKLLEEEFDYENL